MESDPVVSTVKRASDDFSAMIPLHLNQHGLKIDDEIEFSRLPSDNLFSHIFKPGLYLRNIDILSPSSLTFSRRLVVLLGRLYRGHHFQFERIHFTAN